MPDFSDALAAQREFESLFVSFDRLAEGDSEYLDTVADYLSKSLAREAFELMDEFNWKQHAKIKNHNRDKQVEEAIDCFTFSLNLMLILGMSEEEIIECYFLKNRLNWDRQVDEGRATKEQAQEAQSKYMDVHGMS